MIGQRLVPLRALLWAAPRRAQKRTCYLGVVADYRPVYGIKNLVPGGLQRFFAV
jgi:hypothetical protein